MTLSRSASFLTGTALAAGIALAMGAQGCTVSLCDASKDPNCKVDIDSSTGSQDSGGGGVDSSTPDSGFVTDACSVCLYAQCAANHAACETSKDCVGIYNCAIQPGASVRACITARPAGEAAYTGLYQCDQRHACTTCATQCASDPVKTSCDTWVAPAPADAGSGTDAAPVLTEAGAEGKSCDSCVASKCATEKGACGAGSECNLYSQCVQGCIDKAASQLDACFDACATAFPTGKTQGTALSTCTTTNCSSECF